MPLTHTYQKYILNASFGVISNDSVPIFYIKDVTGRQWKYCATGSNSDIILWNLRSGTKEAILKRDAGMRPVSTFAVCTDNMTSETFVATGYMDGWVNLFSLSSQKLESSFRAGRHRVTSIDVAGCKIACAAEAELHVQDIISGSGYRLKGHRGAISTVRLVPEYNLLLSGGRDSFIKFWCLRTQHCFLTLTGHPGPVWDFTLSADRKVLVSGSSDSLLRLWRIKYNLDKGDAGIKGESDYLNSQNEASRRSLAEAVPLSDYSSLVDIDFRGTIQRKTLKRVFSLTFDRSGRYLLCQTLDKTVEVYILLSGEERSARLRKKQKKARKSRETDWSSIELNADDELRCVFRVVLPAKLSSCDLRVSRFQSRRRPGEIEASKQITILHILCAFRNNMIEEYSLKAPEAITNRSQLLHAKGLLNQSENESRMETPMQLVNRIAAPGHRSAPIACQLTEDALGVFTLARGEAKLWSRTNFTCLITLDWGGICMATKISDHGAFATDVDEDDDIGVNLSDKRTETASMDSLKASAFVLAPGSRHAVIGFENGIVCLFDLLSKSVTQTLVGVHKGAIRSLILTGDRKGVLCGSADKLVSFWSFDLSLINGGTPMLCLKLIRPSETVADQVTAICCTPDCRLIAVALVNLHVDVYFMDTFKRVHSLYGMAAPVTCMDVSADGRQLITGSADKTVRLWELQFGNCLRRFTEHSEPVTSVRFLHGSSLAFSSDLGGNIKEWDVKKLLEVCNLTGHEGGVACLSAIATKPDLCKKRAKDSERPFKRRRNQSRQVNEDDADAQDDNPEEDVCGGLLVSVGRDFSCRLWCESEELLVMEEEALMAREAAEDEAELVRSEAVVPGAISSEASETGPLGRPTVTTRNAADTLMEAIDIYTQQTGDKLVPSHPLMAAYQTSDPDRFLFSVFTSMRLPLSGGLAGLEHALGAVHSDHVARLLPRLAVWLERGWDVELVGRAIRYLCILHSSMVTTNGELCDTLQITQHARRTNVSKTRKMVGVNLAALEFLRQKIEEDQPVVFFNEASTKHAARVKKNKERMTKRAAVAIG